MPSNNHFRYVDDILLTNITDELNIDNKIPFLGVIIDTSNIRHLHILKKIPILIPAPPISIVNISSVIKEPR